MAKTPVKHKRIPCWELSENHSSRATDLIHWVSWTWVGQQVESVLSKPSRAMFCNHLFWSTHSVYCSKYILKIHQWHFFQCTLSLELFLANCALKTVIFYWQIHPHLPISCLLCLANVCSLCNNNEWKCTVLAYLNTGRWPLWNTFQNTLEVTVFHLPSLLHAYSDSPQVNLMYIFCTGMFIFVNKSISTSSNFTN